MTSIEALNTVETSVETWQDFIDASMASDFYRVTLNHTGDLELAASLTLLRSYIGTFAPEEQRRIESDVEEFYRYARGFISELAPYRYSKDGYNEDVRAAFIGKIRTLLAAQKNAKGVIVHKDKYIFIRTLVKFCSSLKYIISVHDRYKQFLFRDLPQIQRHA
jgi:adenine-specific DNA methylase